MTKVELATATGLTSRAVTSHECGEKLPGEPTIERYCQVLSFPDAFFFEADPERVDLDTVSFRSLKSMTAKQRDAALGACSIALELNAWISRKFALPEVTLPDMRGEDPEAAAIALRNEWMLGCRPVRNVVHLMELRGIRVYSLSERNKQVDAFSFWKNNTPFCFLNTLKSVEHSRFDAAHELGHLVLHRHGAQRGNKNVEREADAFASAFLMPREAVIDAVGVNPILTDLLQRKHLWGVSLAALTHRSHRLGLLSPWQYRTTCIQISEKGYRTNEPSAMTTRETSQVLAKVFQALREHKVTPGQVAAELRVHREDLEALVFGLVTIALEGAGVAAASSDKPIPRLRLIVNEAG